MDKINKWKENNYENINDLGYLQYGLYCETCGQSRLNHLDIKTGEYKIFNESFDSSVISVSEFSNCGRITL